MHGARQGPSSRGLTGLRSTFLCNAMLGLDKREAGEGRAGYAFLWLADKTEPRELRNHKGTYTCRSYFRWRPWNRLRFTGSFSLVWLHWLS
jgi:hypothetical protein